MHLFQHDAMATQFTIRCEHEDEPYARQAARAAFAEVDRLEQQLSRFVENSDITRINHLAAGEETRIGYETMECLRVARLAWEESEGAFDPSIGTGFDRLEIVPELFAVRARDEGARLDLGAIGKGYAVDRVADVLEDWDVTRALVDAGCSSVLALEPPASRDGWPLTFTVPGPPGDVFARTEARQRVLGASGIRKGEHIRDPRTGTPVRLRRAAWLSAPRALLAEMSRRCGVERPSPAALADALSTAFMVAGREWIDQYCGAHAGLDAWIVEK